MTDPLVCRQRVLASARRVVIKVGSRLLADTKRAPKQDRIAALIAHIAHLRARGLEVVLVSSGAIATGMQRLQLKARPKELPMLQALAAVGQARLMALYDAACERHGFASAQVLLSADDVRHRQRHLNTRNCLDALLTHQILPIINENDTVSVEEIKFGDNDKLASLVASMLFADLTILLTSVDGLRQRQGEELGERISVVENLDATLRGHAGGTDGNPFSTGGMASKLEAAGVCLASGEHAWIADGSDFTVLEDIFAGKDVGTLFVPSIPKLPASKRFLAFFAEPSGTVRVDEGAVRALCAEGRSLLASGVRGVEGSFPAGATVRVCDPAGHAVAVGISHYSSADLDRIKGLRSAQVAVLLGGAGSTEAIHRNNLAVLQG